MSPPNTFYLPPTLHSPGSTLPILHYRDDLPHPRTEETASKFLTAHTWEKRGVWGAIDIRHFHPNTHECYGVFQGASTLLLGAAGGDGNTAGLKLTVYPGDVLVLPAGTAHSSVDSKDDYRYVGVYPRACPRWRNEMGNYPIDLKALRKEIAQVPLPEADPVYGGNGPLCQLWSPNLMAKL
ncbi:hypothetical protein BJX96DRAFT_180958 [Aspergillus floccosus]